MYVLFKNVWRTCAVSNPFQSNIYGGTQHCQNLFTKCFVGANFFQQVVTLWWCDQLRWSNQGVQMLPRKDPTIKKSYFFVSSSSGPSKLFMKHAFELLAPNDVPTVLIHYIGGEKCAILYAHRNATSDSKRKYVRTCPSVIQSLKYSCTMGTAVKSYRNHILEVSSPQHFPVKHPRNIKQVKNIRIRTL